MTRPVLPRGVVLSSLSSRGIGRLRARGRKVERRPSHIWVDDGWRACGGDDAKVRKIAVGPTDSLWLGQLGFDVVTENHQVMGRMTVALDEQVLRCRFFGREQGVLDRDQVRAWLHEPTGQLVTEWLSFSSRGDRLHLSMGISRTHPFALPQHFVHDLRSRI